MIQILYKGDIWVRKAEAEKRIAELEATGRELLIDAMNLYSHYPNNFRNTVEEYFAEEIKAFGLSEGGADI